MGTLSKLLTARRVAVVAAVCAVLLVAGVAAVQRTVSVEGTIEAAETFEVRRGALTISILEAGAVNAREQIILKSEVEGQTQIIYLIDEGTEVAEGDLLVELDASALVDNRVDQEIRVQNAEAAYINARENFEVVKNQAESDIAAAELGHTFAQGDLKQYIEGDYPMELKRADAEISLAESEQKRTQDLMSGSRQLFDKGFITTTQFERDKQLADKAVLELELARASLELLKNYTYERKVTELDSAVTETRRALERAKLKAAADIVQAEANLKAQESEYSREQDKLAKLDTQITKTKIHAPASGTAIHATTGRGGGWRSSQEPLDEGQMVRERQDLIYLPTARAMMAEIRVHEANLSKVRPGLGVRLTVDALPGQSFTGHIEQIAPLPDAQSAFMNPDLKEYKTTVNIDGDAGALRTGMTCQAEIMVEHLDDAVYVPVQSVFLVKGEPTAFVVKNKNTVEPRPVEIGLDNNRMIHIVNGLEPGERVLLTPPLNAAAKSTGEETGEVNEGNGFIAPTEITPPSGSGGLPRPGDEFTPRPEGRPTRDEDVSEGPSDEDGRAALRERMRNMTPEEREAFFRERMQNMSPEDRERWEQRQRGRGNGGASPRGPQSEQ